MRLVPKFTPDCYFRVRVISTAHEDGTAKHRVFVYQDAVQCRLRSGADNDAYAAGAESIGVYSSYEKARVEALDFQLVMLTTRRLLGITSTDPEDLLPLP
jgi:hypothetical protein